MIELLKELLLRSFFIFEKVMELISLVAPPAHFLRPPGLLWAVSVAVLASDTVLTLLVGISSREERRMKGAFFMVWEEEGN